MTIRRWSFFTLAAAIVTAAASFAVLDRLSSDSPEIGLGSQSPTGLEVSASLGDIVYFRDAVQSGSTRLWRLLALSTDPGSILRAFPFEAPDSPILPSDGKLLVTTNRPVDGGRELAVEEYDGSDASLVRTLYRVPVDIPPEFAPPDSFADFWSRRRLDPEAKASTCFWNASWRPRSGARGWTLLTWNRV